MGILRGAKAKGQRPGSRRQVERSFLSSLVKKERRKGKSERRIGDADQRQAQQHGPHVTGPWAQPRDLVLKVPSYQFKRLKEPRPTDATHFPEIAEHWFTDRRASLSDYLAEKEKKGRRKTDKKTR